MVIFIIGFFLLQLHIEYLTYLILLLYLGGIIIFFLFTTLMLNNEYKSSKGVTQFSLEHLIFTLFFFKCFFFLTYLNYKLCIFITTLSTSYLPTHIENNYFYKELLNNQGDAITFMSLYTEKFILLLILGAILLFTMIGVIVITRSKHV